MRDKVSDFWDQLFSHLPFCEYNNARTREREKKKRE